MDEQNPNGCEVESEPATGEVNVSENALSVIDAEFDLRLGDHHIANYQDVLNKAAVVSRDLAQIISDRGLSVKIGQKTFVMVEGWTTCGAMLGVAIRPVSCDENPTCPGEFVAVVEAVRTGDGFILGRGIASCGPDERDWTKRSRQARRSMAQTRAAGKAMRLLFSWIMEMAGYAATPFEEMEGCQVNEQPNPQPHPQAPTEQPRAKREPKPQPISREQCAELLAAWKAIPGNQSEPSGDVAKWHARFFDFARKVSGRDDFDPSRAANWTVSDYEAVDRALTALGDK
jgi:hypothetical protein